METLASVSTSGFCDKVMPSGGPDADHIDHETSNDIGDFSFLGDSSVFDWDNFTRYVSCVSIRFEHP